MTVNTADADNTDAWIDADVYVSFIANPTIPAEGVAFGAQWFLAGLLDGEEGFTEKAEFADDDKHYAWGGILFRRTRGKFEFTKTFTAFERNYATDRLRWPGSSATTLVVPTLERVTMAFETTDGTEVRRIISNAGGVECTPADDLTENENDPTKWKFDAVFYPDPTTKQFATRQEYPDITSA